MPFEHVGLTDGLRANARRALGQERQKGQGRVHGTSRRRLNACDEMRLIGWGKEQWVGGGGWWLVGGAKKSEHTPYSVHRVSQVSNYHQGRSSKSTPGKHGDGDAPCSTFRKLFPLYSWRHVGSSSTRVNVCTSYNTPYSVLEPVQCAYASCFFWEKVSKEVFTARMQSTSVEKPVPRAWLVMKLLDERAGSREASWRFLLTGWIGAGGLGLEDSSPVTAVVTLAIWTAIHLRIRTSDPYVHVCTHQDADIPAGFPGYSKVVQGCPRVSASPPQHTQAAWHPFLPAASST